MKQSKKKLFRESIREALLAQWQSRVVWSTASYLAFFARQGVLSTEIFQTNHLYLRI